MAKSTTFGAVLKKGATTVAQLRRLGDFNLATTELIDCTTHDTTGNMREYLPSEVGDTDEFDAELAYDPADSGHQALITAATPPVTAEAWDVELNAATAKVWRFTGIITKLTMGEQTDNGLQLITASFKRTSGALSEDPA